MKCACTKIVLIRGKFTVLLGQFATRLGIQMYRIYVKYRSRNFSTLQNIKLEAVNKQTNHVLGSSIK